jgi:hypothetical protein
VLTRRQRLRFLDLASTGAELLEAARILGRAHGLRGFEGEQVGVNALLGRALDDARWWRRAWRLCGEGVGLDEARARAALEERDEFVRAQMPRPAAPATPATPRRHVPARFRAVHAETAPIRRAA